MNKEIKCTEDALIVRLGQMVKENVELEQRVRQLTDEYNEVVRQLRGQEKRKDEDPASRTVGQIRDLFNKESLAFENEELKIYARAVDSFMKDKGLYIPKGESCPFIRETIAVTSNFCLECTSCLRVFDDYGIVCQQHLNDFVIGSAK